MNYFYYRILKLLEKTKNYDLEKASIKKTILDSESAKGPVIASNFVRKNSILHSSDLLVYSIDRNKSLEGERAAKNCQLAATWNSNIFLPKKLDTKNTESKYQYDNPCIFSSSRNSLSNDNYI